MLGVRTNDDRSWGAREEHRVSLALLMSINEEMKCRGYPELRRRETRKQWYIIPTWIVNRFIECVTLPLARWYQELISSTEDGMLGLDRQKLAILVALILKSSYTSSLLERHPILWEKKNRNHDNIDKPSEYGLGFKETIEKHGFAWLSLKIFDWRNNTFQAGVGDNFPFPVRQVDKLYRVRKQERRTMSNLLQEIDHVIGRLNLLSQSHEDLAAESFIIQWLAMRIIRQYHIDVWTKLFASSYEFKGKDTERQTQKETEAEEEYDNSSSESRYDEEDINARPRKRQRLGSG